MSLISRSICSIRSLGEICAPAVVFSMRSSFYFLPQTGLCFETPEGAPLPVDFYDPHSWSTYNLSPVTAGLYQSPQDANPAGSAAPGLDKLAAENQHRETGKSAQDQARDRHAEMHGRGADEATSWGAGAVLGLGSAPPPSHSTPVSTSSDEAGRRRGVSITSGKTIRTPKCENEGEVYPDRGTESQQSRQNTAGDEEDDDDEDGDDPNPTPPDFAELEKVLSSSDAAISTYLTKTLNRVKQVCFPHYCASQRQTCDFCFSDRSRNLIFSRLSISFTPTSKRVTPSPNELCTRPSSS